MDKVWRIGLTGGIGSGKSTAAQVLAQLGAAVIDADALARSVTAPGGSAIGPLRAAFGEAVLDAHGGLDRQRMRELAFSDPRVKAQLEAIVHPLVKQSIEEQAQSAMAAGAQVLVFDIPLLVESIDRWRPQLDRVCVVDCQPETQIQRVMARSGISRQAVAQIMSQQATRAERLACADVVILNDGIDLAQLKQRVHEMWVSFGL